MTDKFLILLACLLLGSCGDKQAASIENVETAIDLPVTSEVLLPEKGVAYAFVPNDAAQWLSQIIILSEDGDLYQAAADTRKARPIEGPKAKSIIGLSRPGAPGMFLALSQNGNLKSYIEANDQGDFILQGENIANLDIKKHCEENETVECLFKSNGDIEAFNPKSIVTLPTADNTINLKPYENGIMVSQGNNSGATKAVTIASGITIPGVPNPQSIYVVSDNFGGPFNNGLVLVSDADEPRFALISADFARKTLADQASE